MSAADDADYILGHGSSERHRLELQATFMEPLTRRALIDAGVRTGMSVLDVGSGFGDVTLLAADLVGPTGAVVGIERDAGAVAMATARARDRRADNVRFVAGDVRTQAPGEMFDAAIGRFVLMYLATPDDAVAAAAAHVVGGGLVAFQEWHAADSFLSSPRVELWDATGELVTTTFAEVGTSLTMGLDLRRCFAAAGLVDPVLRAERLAGGGPGFGGYEYLAGVVRSIAPVIERLGLATAADLDLDTLGARLRDAVTAADATVALPSIVSAWARRRDRPAAQQP